MAVEVNRRVEFLRPGYARATATPGAGALPRFPRLVRPARPASTNNTRLEDLRRRRRIRRLRQVGNAALWVAGSGVLTTLALGGLFSLR